MNAEINEKKENQKEQVNTDEKRQPIYQQEAVQRAKNPRINFKEVGKGLEKAGNAVGSGVEKTLQHAKAYMDSFDM